MEINLFTSFLRRGKNDTSKYRNWSPFSNIICGIINSIAVLNVSEFNGILGGFAKRIALTPNKEARATSS